MHKVSVIILNYKKYADLREAIISVRDQKCKDTSIDVLVIDNNSGDQSTQKIATEFPESSYLYNTENVGFARGVNQGIRQVFNDSDYFLLMNDDAVLSPECISELVKASEGKYITGPTIFYKNTDVIWQAGGVFSKLKMGINIPNKNKKNKSTDIQDVDFLSGCVMLIPKLVIQKIGYFDEKFYFYGEDLDFCQRAVKSDLKIKYIPYAKAWHNIGFISVSRTNPFVLKNLAIAYFLIIKKHFPKLKWYGLMLFICLYTPFRIWQIIKGGSKINNIKAWFIGGKIGWQTKI